MATTVALSAVALSLLPLPASAHPGDGGVSEEGVIAPGSEEAKQHGGDEGHLPPVQEGVRLVGQAPIEGAAEGRVADVAAFGRHAYLTVRDPEGCSGAGVAVMDISDPSSPRQVAFIDATEGSFPGEGAQVLDIATPAFTGQVLLFNNEICRSTTGRGGVSLVDVTNPAAPVVLTANAGDATRGTSANAALNDTHSVLGWTDGGRAFAVLVDNPEAADVDILEISDPRKPVLLSETDLNDFGVLQEAATPLGGNSFLHDVEVQEIDGTMTMIASYWDGGWTLLDVDDPAKPVYLDDYDYAATDPLTGLTTNEGNAHQAEFSPDGRLIVGTDEDFSPFRLTFTARGQDFQAAQGSATPQLDSATGLSGTPVYLGRACTADGPLPAAGAATIAVIERGGCSFTEKASNVDAAGGYTGVVLFNSTIDCTGIVTPSVQGKLPFVSVARSTGFAIFGAAYDSTTCPATPFAKGTTADAVSAAAVFDGWGYTRLMTTDGLQEIGAYAIDEALDPAYATGFGDLSVHEVAVDPHRKGLAYLSYYSGGLRVVEYGDDGIREVGAYIAEGGNNFWGVEYHQLPAGKSQGKGKAVGRGLILASDRDSGLWIFEYPGGKGAGDGGR